MVRDGTSRRSATHCGLKGEPKVPPARQFTGPIIPTAQNDGLRADEFHIDPKVAHLLASGRVEPAQELAQAVAVRDDVHSWPVDRCLLVMDHVRGSEEWKKRIWGHTGPILVEKVVALVLHDERELAPSPHARRTCIQSDGVRPSERAIS